MSLIVSTYNRAEYLKKSLETFANQTISNTSYEIIVVDNNSTDDTAMVFKSLSEAYCNHNWVYLIEPRQGLHYARNRGILIAKGDIIVFGDDDIEASQQWLESVQKAFDNDDNIGVVGGPIFPIWDRDPPGWIYDYGTKDIHGVFAYLNYGKISRVLEKEAVFGCNFAIRNNLAFEIGGSGPDTFPNHMIHYSGAGETAMLVRVRATGYKVFYSASAVVRHHASTTRCTPEYFSYRYKRVAVEAIHSRYNRGVSLLGVLCYIVKVSLKQILRVFEEFVRRRKINRLYFVQIMTNYILFSWKHYAKLLFNKELRKYTKIKNNLHVLNGD